MQNRNLDRKALRVTRSVDYFGDVTTYQSLETWGHDILTVIHPGTYTGDFRSPNPFEYVKSSGSSRFRGSWGQVSNQGLQNQTVYNGPAPYVWAGKPIPAHATWLYDQAISQVFEKLRSNVDLSIDVAQAAQTRRMLAATGQLTRYIRSFHPKKWASKWLEFQYGWRPLLGTIYSSAEAIRHLADSGFSLGVGRASETENLRTTLPLPWDPSASYVTETNISRRCEVKALFRLNLSAFEAVGQFTSLNPASLAWELLPYSFVVDWVYDIGGYLRNLENAFLYRSNFVSAYRTYTYKYSSQARINVRRPTLYFDEFYYLSADVVQSGKRREVLSNLPFPDLPRVDLNLGWQRVVSAASLIGTHLGRRR